MKIQTPFSIIIILLLMISCESSLTSEQLLLKAIEYHDPDDKWSGFNGLLNITMTIPDQSDRNSEILINLPEEHFYSKATRDTVTIEYEIMKDNCTITFNGKIEFSEEEIKTYGLTCERAQMYKNYYTYLYGLPMKLKDPGTHISETIEQKTFKGKEYLVLKATYDESVGSDIWFFYFDPETFAMEIYQFFKTDESGALDPESGEYILLSEESIVNNVIMPKVRAWYYNKDDKYLGTDTLN
jgi:hypothetical protein